MTPNDVVDIGRESILVLIRMAGPIMIIGLIVGVAISLLQALTQIQEMTIAFVPKILVVFVVTILLLPFMMTTLTDFTLELTDRIVAIGLNR
ncbi:MAG: flagellar biosynthesis protein FliQ [Alphaproteobacteria bacterium]|nr:flagellar biosynthesis protein FliQ [Alphaproteobacteria bacterium]